MSEIKNDRPYMSVQEAFDPDLRAAQEWDTYMKGRPVEDTQGNIHDPANGQTVNAEEYFDSQREIAMNSSQTTYEAQSVAELTSRLAEAVRHGDKTSAINLRDVLQFKYESMSTPALARQLAWAEFNGDKATEVGVSDALIDKLGEQEDQALSKKDREHNNTRSDNLWNRIMSIKDKELKRLQKEAANDPEKEQFHSDMQGEIVEGEHVDEPPETKGDADNEDDDAEVVDGEVVDEDVDEPETPADEQRADQEPDQDPMSEPEQAADDNQADEPEQPDEPEQDQTQEHQMSTELKVRIIETFSKELRNNKTFVPSPKLYELLAKVAGDIKVEHQDDNQGFVYQVGGQRINSMTARFFIDKIKPQVWKISEENRSNAENALNIDIDDKEAIAELATSRLLRSSVMTFAEFQAVQNRKIGARKDIGAYKNYVQARLDLDRAIRDNEPEVDPADTPVISPEKLAINGFKAFEKTQKELKSRREGWKDFRAIRMPSARKAIRRYRAEAKGQDPDQK